MKVIEIKLVTELPKGELRMWHDGGTPEHAAENHKMRYGYEPKVAYLINGIYYCAVEEAKDD